MLLLATSLAVQLSNQDNVKMQLKSPINADMCKKVYWHSFYKCMTVVTAPPLPKTWRWKKLMLVKISKINFKIRLPTYFSLSNSISRHLNFIVHLLIKCFCKYAPSIKMMILILLPCKFDLIYQYPMKYLAMRYMSRHKES